MNRFLFKLISIWVQIRNLWLYYFRHAIIVNCWVDDHTWSGINHRNWGDDLNYYFIKFITGRPVVTLFNFRLARKFNFKNFMCIGSLLGSEGTSLRKTVVWGTGMFGEKLLPDKPLKICSVRGPRTRQFIQNQGIECPAKYGDPALLLPLYYHPDIKKKYKVGIIPHVSNLDDPTILRVQKSRKDILIINLENYKIWTDIIDQILSCECILSSSLHGLIVSDAYNIPNVWIKLNGRILGGNFKYIDYAESVGRKLVSPLSLQNQKDLEQAIHACGNWHKLRIDTDSILKACPFAIKQPKYRLHE